MRKRPFFHFLSKIWRHRHLPQLRFPIRRGNFCDSAINKGNIAYFLLRMRETAIFPLPIWGRLQLIFSSEKQIYVLFLLPVYLAYWPRKRATCWATHVDHFRHVWSWYDYPSPSSSVVGADTLRDRVTLTFDLLTLDSGQTWQVTWATPPPSFKILRLSVLDLWVDDVRHRPPLTMRLDPLRMHRITWPVRRGKFSQIFEIPDPDCLFTMPIHYTTFMELMIKGRLLGISPMLRRFRAKISESLRKRAPKWRFFGQKGV